MNTFGIIIPGQPCITSFVPTDTSNTKFTLELPFSFVHTPENNTKHGINSPLSPLEISQLTFFLLPNVTLPSNVGAMLYWSASTPTGVPNQTSTGFELLGALTPTKPTAILQTRWRDNESLLNLLPVGANSSPGYTSSGLLVNINITLGVSIEPLENIQNLGILSTDHSIDSKSVAKKVALDLFNFLQSFDTGEAPNGWMTVPTNVFDRWFQRFERKIDRDPVFFLKSQD